MPPIPIHLNDPINPNTTTGLAPDGTTPQTNPPPTRTTPFTPATTTSSSSPPAPQPGAHPVPTSTASSSSSDPPAPQPGAVPTAANPYAPRTIEKVITTTETHAPPPPQTTLPPPTDNQLAGKSTLAYTPANIPPTTGPTTLPLGGVQQQQQQQYPPQQQLGSGPSPIERPPGYVQNVRAFEDPPELREAKRREEEEEGGLLRAVKGAGESLRKGEEAVWKWVGGKAG